jgi:SOS response regulatory protein OraA/RecX
MSETVSPDVDARIIDQAEELESQHSSVVDATANDDGSITALFTKDKIDAKCQRTMMNRGFAVSEIERLDVPTEDNDPFGAMHSPRLSITFRQVADL